MNILDPNFTNCNDLEILLCMPPSEETSKVLNSLLNLGCKVYPTKSQEDALAKLKFHAFPVVILEETYSLKIMQHLACLPSVLRRNIFYLVIGSSLETGNTLQAFVISANFVVHNGDIASFGQIFQSAILTNNRIYRPLQTACEKWAKEPA
ncbi:MAG TPA: hypothetical protein PLR86_01070 [Planctomycetota bacterium]|nr:hypothetical protein [Planctomycetota bacterium]